MQNSRRKFIQKSLLLSGMGFTMPSALEQSHLLATGGGRLVLLGTQGGPFINSYKQTPSANLIVYKSTPFIIDTGYGVTFKLKEAGVNLSTLKYILLRHHHSDHNLELGPLLYNAWVKHFMPTLACYPGAAFYYIRQS